MKASTVGIALIVLGGVVLASVSTAVDLPVQDRPQRVNEPQDLVEECLGEGCDAHEIYEASPSEQARLKKVIEAIGG